MASEQTPKLLGHSFVMNGEPRSLTEGGMCVLCGKEWRPEIMFEDCPNTGGMTPQEHMAVAAKYLDERQ